MSIIMDGKKISDDIKGEIFEHVKKLKSLGKREPGLAVILVGEDPGSQVYVKNKITGCEKVGFHSEVYRLAKETNQQDLLKLIEELNASEKIDGILVQKPLPLQIDNHVIDLAISADKDVDCFHPLNVGKLNLNMGLIMPCTPAGIMEILSRYDIDPSGKNAVIIGRSDIVGKPIAQLLLAKNATITICHSKTVNLKEIVLKADIIIAAIGKARFVTNDMVKQGAVVVDVGINRENGKLYGDVDYENVYEKASYITPVPGGVGPMTIAMLLVNTLNISAGRKLM